MAYVSKSIVRRTFSMTSVHAHNAYAIALKSRLHCICVYFKISMCMHVHNVIFKSKQCSDQKISYSQMYQQLNNLININHMHIE